MELDYLDCVAGLANRSEFCSWGVSLRKMQTTEAWCLGHLKGFLDRCDAAAYGTAYFLPLTQRLAQSKPTDRQPASVEWNAF
jgi:hypothetical protein